MEHFLFYAMGLSFVSFLSIILTKPPVELPPYQIPQPSSDEDQMMGGQARVTQQMSEIPTLAGAAPGIQEVIDTAVCHPLLSPTRQSSSSMAQPVSLTSNA